MATANIVCLIHRGDTSVNAIIKPFDKKSWETILSAKQLRLSKFSEQSKYHSVCANLPDEFNTEMGYHLSCYRKFTAVSKTVRPEESIVESHDHPQVLRSKIQHPEATSSGIFKPVCIFCGCERKTVRHKVEFLGNCETREAQDAITNAAMLLQDNDMLAKISHIDFVAKEVKYHHT